MIREAAPCRTPHLEPLSRSPHPERSRSYAIAGVIVLMIVWGSTFVVTKKAVEEIPPLTLAALRFVIATATFIPLVILRGGFQGLPKPVPVIPLLLMAFMGIALFTSGFNFGLLYGSAVQGSLIYAFVPAAVAIGQSLR